MFEDDAYASVETPENLGLLLDMELPLTISLGRRKMPLSDVLRLGVGCTVELSRFADESVDVVVNDRIVARGEVVVVEGNYGIRITEVASRATRLESTGSPRATQTAANSGAGNASQMGLICRRHDCEMRER